LREGGVAEDAERETKAGEEGGRRGHVNR
jgi:hypothetical protein